MTKRGNYSQWLTELRRANPEGFTKLVNTKLDHYEKFVVYLRTSLKDEERILSYREIASMAARELTVEDVQHIERVAYNRLCVVLGLKSLDEVMDGKGLPNE